MILTKSSMRTQSKKGMMRLLMTETVGLERVEFQGKVTRTRLIEVLECLLR